MRADSYRGVGVALVTPMRADGSVDEDALRDHVAYQLAGGVDFLVPCGTTGESATLRPEEQRRVVEVVARAAGNASGAVDAVRPPVARAPVMAGAGGSDTARVVELAMAAVEAGADAILSVSPAYNKPSPAGLIAHYQAVAGAVDAPVFIYNVPGRTASNVPPDVVLELAQIHNICGIKEASGNLEQVMTLLRERPDDFLVLSGEDSLTLAMVGLGADGVVSVVANQTPRAFVEMVQAAMNSDIATAREIHYRILPLMRANFLETNPIPVKAGLAMMGRMEEYVRLPLVPLDAESEVRRMLRAALAEANVPANVPTGVEESR
jgi:4-hydroxy-tetrahydrodipicolinate synthase